MSFQGIKEEVRKLSRPEQAELMHFMIELLASEGPALSEAWKLELDKRESALDTGASIGRPVREVLNKYKESN